MKEPRQRGRLTYQKKPLSTEKLIDRLTKKGLIVSSPQDALRALSGIGYYRLTPYFLPFYSDAKKKSFKPGIQFDDVLGLYLFDKELRLLILDAIESVEVALRTSITDYMAVTYQNAHWYSDSRHFKNHQKHGDLCRIIGRTCEAQLRSRYEKQSEPSALEHYLITYGEPELPPSWVVMELLTIGQLRSLYTNLERRSDKTAIARKLGVTTPLLESWLDTFVRIRNISAHHG